MICLNDTYRNLNVLLITSMNPLNQLTAVSLRNFVVMENIFTSISQKQSNRLDRKYAYKWFDDLWGVCLNGSRSQIKFKNHCIVTKIKVLHDWGLHYSRLNVKRLKNESFGRNYPYFFCITNFFSFWYKFTHIVNGSCSFSFETSQ